MFCSEAAAAAVIGDTGEEAAVGEPWVSEDQEGEAERPQWPWGEASHCSVWFWLEQRL